MFIEKNWEVDMNIKDIIFITLIIVLCFAKLPFWKAKQVVVVTYNINYQDENLYRAISRLNPVLTVTEREEIIGDIHYVSDKFDIPVYIICAIIEQETNFEPNAISSTDAKGIMQIMDILPEVYGVNKWMPYAIDRNILLAGLYLRDRYKYHGNWRNAIRNYYAGYYLALGNKYYKDVSGKATIWNAML